MAISAGKAYNMQAGETCHTVHEEPNIPLLALRYFKTLAFSAASFLMAEPYKLHVIFGPYVFCSSECLN